MIDKIREKLKKFWKWIIALILGGTVLAAGIILQPEEIPFVIVNGERIEFPYTDENSNENFIIHTDKQTYGGWDKAEVYAMVENKSGVGQTINLQAFFSDNKESIISVSKLKQDIPYQITVNDYATSTYDCGYYEYTNGSTTKTWIDKTCEKQKIIGTHQETKYKDEWQSLPILPFSKADYDSLISIKNIPIKDKKGFVAEKKVEDLVLKNEIVYFKIEIQVSEKSEGEFFIEIVGSERGYSHLDPWYNTNWLYKKKITIDEAKIDDDLTNFPVAVILASSTNFDFTKARGDGYDVIFTKDDEATLLDFERERYSTTTGNAEFWVKIPSVASSTASTTFYMYYGNSGASDIASSTAVWDSTFKAVYHLNDASGAMLDSTAEDNDGTYSGDLPDPIDGKIGKGQDFDGTGDYGGETDNDFNIQTGDWCMEFWVKADTVSVNNGLIHLGNSNYNVIAVQQIVADESIAWMVSNNQTSWTPYHTVAGALPAGIWVHFAYRRNGDVLSMFKNGASIGSDTITGTYYLNNYGLYLGKAYWGAGYEFNGIIDEFRISNNTRTDAWVKATYNSGNDSLLTFGSEESGAVRRIIIVE